MLPFWLVAVVPAGSLDFATGPHPKMSVNNK
jgi:hypothetical protein